MGVNFTSSLYNESNDGDFGTANERPYWAFGHSTTIHGTLGPYDPSALYSNTLQDSILIDTTIDSGAYNDESHHPRALVPGHKYKIELTFYDFEQVKFTIDAETYTISGYTLSNYSKYVYTNTLTADNHSDFYHISMNGWGRNGDGSLASVKYDVKITEIIPPKPDLTTKVSKVLPVSVSAGSELVVHNTINNGGKEGSDSANIGYYLSSNDVITTSDVFLGKISSGSINSGTTKAFEIHISLSKNVAPGKYYVGVIADYDGKVDETNEGNNTSNAIAVTVTAPTFPVNVVELITPAKDALSAFFDANEYALKVGNLVDTAEDAGGIVGDDFIIKALTESDDESSAFRSWSAKGLAKELDASTLKKFTTNAGYVLDAFSAAMTGYETLKASGDLGKAIQDASVKFIAAVASGKIGTVVGASAAGSVAAYVAGSSLLVGTGVPLIVGLGVGFAVAKGVDYLAKVGANKAGLYSYEPGDAAFKVAAVAAVADGELDLPLTISESTPKAAWEFNVETGQFKWLDKDLESKYGQIATALGVNPAPKGLQLFGDKFEASDDDSLFGRDASDRLFGLSGNDFIAGSAGDDLISGGVGRDTLIGEDGADAFLFDATLSKSTNVDVIVDFQPGIDHIHLDRDVFTKIKGSGELKSKFFVDGKKAKDKNDRIIYNEKRGDILYDANGSKKGKVVKFADVTPGQDLSSDDFVLVA